MKNSERIGLLMFRSMRNKLTRKQRKELLAWRNQSPKHETAFQEATDWENVLADLQWSEHISNDVLEKIKEKYPGLWKTEEEKPKAKIRLIPLLMRVAGITIFLLSFIVYRYSVYESARPHPGTYAGIINGSSEVPIFHDFIRGFKAARAHLEIVEHENGDIDYVATNDLKHPDKIYNLRTYRGNAFVLRLPGVGSIWVNASTDIWYPAKFVSDTLRIKLTGEAYFEMTGNKPVVIEIPSTVTRQPPTFIRKTGSFNVHAYRTDSLKVANDELSAGWKNRMIYFKDASLKTILDEISRWYDVDLEYKGTIPNRKFNIRLPRNTELSRVIRVLNDQGANLFVSRKNIYVL